MDKAKILTLLLVAFVFAGAQVKSQIVLPSVITDSLYLNATDSFYYTTGSVTVKAGAKLVIDKNVEVRIAPSSNLTVSGQLVIKGDSLNRVLFTSTDTTRFWGYINASYASVDINGVDIRFATRFINASHGSIVLKNSTVDKTYGGIGADCIGVHYADSLYISGCYLNGNPSKARIDAMDCDAIKNGIITNNTIQNFEDDGVDVGTGTKLITVTNNLIYNCNFGISVGENSTVVAERNVIIKCDAGMQSHTGSTIKASHNTLYNNVKGFELHHGSSSNSGGSLILNSSIVANTRKVLYTEQTNSSFAATFCLSDSLEIAGENNLIADPLFVEAEVWNFNLLEGSPCIDAADPTSPLDEQNNFADIGAFEFAHVLGTDKSVATNADIIIYPNPASDYIVIESAIHRLWRYDIVSVSGEVVLKGETNQAEQQINMSDLTNGIYLIRVISSDGLLSKTRTIIVQ